MKWKSINFLWLFLIICLFLFSACVLQRPDHSYDVTVSVPNYVQKSPEVLYDEAHLNTHKASKTYEPLINLYENDGCNIAINTKPFTPELLKRYQLLIICNAKSPKDLPRDVGAFSPDEKEAVYSWVLKGGALLLIADHHPFGLANRGLARMFGVEMGCGRAIDTSRQQASIEFSRENGLLLQHPITDGRSRRERIERILTFSGQSLRGADYTRTLLRFGDHVLEKRPDSLWTEDGRHNVRFGSGIGVKSLSQACTVELGLGRAVILGEAGMLTAQKMMGRKFGMNDSSKPDNKQLAINILHWLLENHHFEDGQR